MDFARADAVEAFLHQNVYCELQAAGVVGATVCLAKVGRYSFTISNCYGFLDAARGVVLDDRTSLFDLGGCAKVLAAVALLRVLQDNELTVATDINDLLPASLQVDSSRYGSVSVQQLLTHTSGLQAGTGGEAPSETASRDSGAAALVSDSLLEPPVEGPCEGGEDVPNSTVMPNLLAQQPIVGAKPPGTYRPQDLDYMLLGAILENLTGEPFERHVREVLLEPLGVRKGPQQQQQSANSISDVTSVAAALAAATSMVEAGVMGTGLTAPVGGEGEGGEAAAGFVFAHIRVPGVAETQGSERGCMHAGAAGQGLAGEEAALQGGLGGPTVQRILVRYDPGPLTPVSGLVLTPRDVARLLPLLVYAPGTSSTAAEQDGGLSGSGVSAGRHILSALCEIRLFDFVKVRTAYPMSDAPLNPSRWIRRRSLRTMLKDAGIAFGGLTTLGLARCGDGVVSCESPPAPPTIRERALLAQAAAASAAASAASQGGTTWPAGMAFGDLAGEMAGEVSSKPPSRPRSAAADEGGEHGVLQGPPRAHPSLLLLAPESGFALVVSCNTDGPEGNAFCRKVASRLLDAFRPAELPRAVVRNWLPTPQPPRQDAVATLVLFPPGGCISPIGYFESWPQVLPDYIKALCMQPPGHGSRRGEACELRLPKLVPPSTAALLASTPSDGPVALFGHGLGALWAFEVARRLETLYQRQVLHLFVSGCAAPACFLGRSCGGVDAAGAEAQGGAAKRTEPWSVPRAAADAPAMYELPDDAFVSACRTHPRFPRQLRTNIKALVEHIPLLRADIEMETKYNFSPPAPTLCASVAAVLASVQNRADDEARVTQGLPSCPITVLIPNEDMTLGSELMVGWEKVTTGQIRFQAIPGDYHYLEDRKNRAQVVAYIAAALGRQMSVHVPWLAKMRPTGVPGRGGSGRSGSRPSSATGSGLAVKLPPMYPRG